MKRCRACNALFQPIRIGAVVCSIPCARQYSRTDREQQRQKRLAAAEKREFRRLNETPAQAAAKAQAAFNAWIRLRDQGLPCISCGHPDDGSRQRHASHYRPRGPNPALRFDESNVHASCSICNNHKSGNLTPYRIELIRRIGLAEVERLEGPHDLPHRTVEDFLAIKAQYMGKLRDLGKAA